MKKVASIIVVGLLVLTGSVLFVPNTTIAGATTPIVKNIQPAGLTNNSPPGIPVITGPTNGKYNVDYNFTFTSTDPDGDNVYYWVEWGDGCPSAGWFGPYPSGQTITVSHTFPRGTWTISCEAKDIYNATSDWGTLTVTMPLALQMPAHGLLAWLFARFPHSFPILRSLLAY
jgi:hypothetical protein